MLWFVVLCCGAVLWAILFGDLHAYTRDVIRELIQNVILVLIFCDLTSSIRMSRKDSFASRFGFVCCVLHAQQRAEQIINSLSWTVVVLSLASTATAASKGCIYIP